MLSTAARRPTDRHALSTPEQGPSRTPVLSDRDGARIRSAPLIVASVRGEQIDAYANTVMPKDFRHATTHTRDRDRTAA